MDDVDRKLMLLIYADPRMTVQQFAKRLGISRQAVNHRLQMLTNLGVFRDIRAAIPFHYLGGVPVYIWGTTKGTSVDKILLGFEETEFTDGVIVLGGDNLLIVGALRDMSELDSYVKFVKRVAEMPEPTIGIPCFGDGVNPPSYDKGTQRQRYQELSSLDLRIIASLKDDARRPTAKIAQKVGVSARTVRRRLEHMKTEGLLTFDMPWDLPRGEDMYTILYVRLQSGADNKEVAKRLISKYPLRITVVRSFSNLPEFLMCLLKSDKMTEIRKILRDIRKDETVMAVTPNLIYFEREYWSWDQRLPAALTRLSERTESQNLMSAHKKRKSG